MNREIESFEPVCRYSVVVPMHNEEAYVRPLYEKLRAAMERLPEPFELIFVDDGSSDQTFPLLNELVRTDPRVRVIRLKRNFGQTAALSAGFDNVAGEIIVALDADLRSDPAEIPLLLEKLAEGYDLVSGWRKDRGHEGVIRTLPSRVANWLISRLSGVRMNDFGTTFKAYRRELLRDLRLYGDQHRFIPALASWQGARIAEIPVSDSPREFGKSHYGIERTVRVFFDLITLRFLLHYISRPLHFFGPAGLFGFLTGSVIMLYLFLQKILYGVHLFVEHGPLMILGVLLFLSGMQLLAVGLIGEMLARTYFDGQQKPVYRIDRMLGGVRLSRTPRQV
ncbi:MAG: glycosyltransferase family 2 protein [Acidobacteria bacterium]|nr:glycosyltransferase family 2 protein [Acidobacteriota bacterium]